MGLILRNFVEPMSRKVQKNGEGSRGRSNVLLLLLSVCILSRIPYYAPWPERDALQSIGQVSQEGEKASTDLNAKQSQRVRQLQTQGSSIAEFQILRNFYHNLAPVDPNEVTLVTHTTPDKFEHLQNLRKRWEGPMSVALYFTSSSDDDVKRFTELKTQHFGETGGNTHFHLFRAKETYTGDYPENFLRNVAMENAVTDYAFVLDVDMLPPADAYESFKNDVLAMKLKDTKRALIVPAFERKIQLLGEAVPLGDLPKTKKSVRYRVAKYSGQVIAPFRADIGYEHGPTNFEKWYEAESSYEVDYKVQYEPFVVVCRSARDLPRFWGGLGLSSWVEELAVAGYTFEVSSSAFVLHVNTSPEEGLEPKVLSVTGIHEYIKFQKFLLEKYGKILWKKIDLQSFVENTLKAIEEKGLERDSTEPIGHTNKENAVETTSSNFKESQKDVQLQTQPLFDNTDSASNAFQTLPNFYHSKATLKQDEVTLVTYMTPNKFYHLQNLRNRWDGPISVAVFFKSSFEEEVKKFTELKTQHFGESGGSTYFHLVRTNETFAEDVPENFLRNVAMDNAVTDYAFVLDVDMLPPPNAYQSLKNDVLASKLKDTKRALIVPAFERKIKVVGETPPIGGLPSTRDIVKNRVSRFHGTVIAPFRANIWYEHGPTNVDRWYEAKSPYTVDYAVQYEPFVVVRRSADDIPRFWEGLGLSSWVEQLAAAGYSLKVSTSAFVIHVNTSPKEGLEPKLMNSKAVHEYIKFQKFILTKYDKIMWDEKDLQKFVEDTLIANEKRKENSEASVNR